MLRMICALACLAAPAAAEDARFGIFLGDTALGKMRFQDGAVQRLQSDVSGSFLGAMDGSFTASSRSGAEGVRYASEGRSERESRVIETLTVEGRVRETRVVPQGEATELSDPAAVPPGTIDPVAGLARMLAAAGCPAPFSIYDGRRVVAIATRAQAVEGDRLTCEMDYRVTAGPGHVSPFRLKKVGMRLVYALSAKPARLEEIVLKAGPLAATLRR